MLGLVVFALPGILLWQNIENQKIIFRLIEKENLSHKSNLEYPKAENNSFSKLQKLPVVKASNLPESAKLNPNDKMYNALSLIAQSNSKNTFKDSSIIDFNGDGLNDIIYHARDPGLIARLFM